MNIINNLAKVSLSLFALSMLASCHCDHDEPRVFKEGHILCADGSVVSLCDFAKIEKQPVGIVFHVDNNDEDDLLGYAVYIHQASPLAFADSLNVNQGTSTSLVEMDGNTNTYAMFTCSGTKSPLADYVFDVWPHGQSAFIPSVAELRLLFSRKSYINERIVAVGGEPITNDDSSCWLWSSTEVEGQEANKAWLFSMNSGNIVETPKNQPHQFRPVIAIRK